MKRVRHPDGVVVERIERFLREETERGVSVLLAGIQPDMWAVLKNVGFDLWFPPEHVFPEEDREFSATLKAVRYAHAQLDSPESDALLDASAVAANAIESAITTSFDEPPSSAHPGAVGIPRIRRSVCAIGRCRICGATGSKRLG